MTFVQIASVSVLGLIIIVFTVSLILLKVKERRQAESVHRVYDFLSSMHRPPTPSSDSGDRIYGVLLLDEGPPFVEFCDSVDRDFQFPFSGHTRSGDDEKVLIVPKRCFVLKEDGSAPKSTISHFPVPVPDLLIKWSKAEEPAGAVVLFRGLLRGVCGNDYFVIGLYAPHRANVTKGLIVVVSEPQVRNLGPNPTEVTTSQVE